MSIEKKIKRGWRWIAQNGGGVSIEGRGVKPLARNVLIFSKEKQLAKRKWNFECNTIQERALICCGLNEEESLCKCLPNRCSLSIRVRIVIYFTSTCTMWTRTLPKQRRR